MSAVTQKRVTYGGIIAGYKEIDAVVEILKGQAWGQGEVTAEFERIAGKKQHRKFALFVNSGSSALLLALATLPKGTRIAMPALQFPTLYSSALWCGLQPVLVDSDDSFNLDPGLIPEDVKAVAFVHIAGNPTNIDLTSDLCRERGIPLIEDNCEGFGGMWRVGVPDAKGNAYDGFRAVGNFGDISCTSTHAAHQISTGEGGLVFTDNEETYLKMKRIRDWGRSYGAATIAGYYENYVFSEIGLNLHASDIQAALGIIQIERLAEFSSWRRTNYDQFRRALRDLPIRLPRVDERAAPSWYTFPFLTERRNELRDYLEAQNIETRPILVGNIARQPMPHQHWQSDGRSNSLPYADAIFERGLWFSVHPRMGVDGQARVIEAMRHFYERG